LAPPDVAVNENVLLKERPNLHPGASECSLSEKNDPYVERIGRRLINLENDVLYAEQEDEEFSLAILNGSCPWPGLFEPAGSKDDAQQKSDGTQPCEAHQTAAF
jgi:hypothetical protein